MIATARWIGRGGGTFAALALAVILCLVVGQVVMRFGFGQPLPWPEELSRIVFIYLVFIGAAEASSDRGHIAVDLVDAFGLPARVDGVFALLRESAVVAVLCVIAYGAWQMIPVVHSMRLPATGVAMSWMVAPVLVGAVLMAVASLLLIVAQLTGRMPPRAGAPQDAA